MVEKFRLSSRREADVVIISIFGYVEGSGGSELKQFCDKALEEGVRHFIIDFRGTELISSPGVAALLDVSNHAVDDFDSRMVCYGLDQHHNAVLEMSGFFFLVQQAADEKTALQAVHE